MNEEVELAFKKLKSAFAALKDGAEFAIDELDKDGVIQRFEFTFELLWKSLKIYLEYQGISVKTPRECLKEAFRIGLIEDEEIFVNMLTDRNKMSHIYAKAVSEQIFNSIKSKYVPSLERLIEKFDLRLKP